MLEAIDFLRFSPRLNNGGYGMTGRGIVREKKTARVRFNGIKPNA
jgi:hypothetical protein